MYKIRALSKHIKHLLVKTESIVTVTKRRNEQLNFIARNESSRAESSDAVYDINNMLLQLDNFDDIIQHIKNNGQGVWPFLAPLLNHLTNIHYNSMAKQYPFIASNSNVFAHMQLQIANKEHNILQSSYPSEWQILADGILSRLSTNLHIYDSVQCLLPRTSFPRYGLKNTQVTSRDNLFTEDDITIILHSLVCLGIPSTDPIFQAVFAECHCRIENFDLDNLARFGRLNRTFSGFSWISCLHSYMQRLKELYCHDRDCTHDSIQLTSWAKALRPTEVFWTNGVMDNIVCKILAKGNCHIGMSTPIRELPFLAIFGRQLCRSRGMVQGRKLLSNVGKVACEHLKIMDSSTVKPYILGDLARSLKSSGLYTWEIAKVFELKASERLNEPLFPAEIINLFFTVSSLTSDSLTRNFENVLYQQMDENNFDALLLSKMADAFCKMRMKNRDIIFRYQELLVKNLENFTSCFSYLYPILIFSHHHPFYNKQHAKCFQELLVYLTSAHPAGKTWFLPATVQYFLSQPGTIPSNIFDKMITWMPGWKLQHLNRLLQGMHASPPPTSSEQRHQQQEIEIALFANILSSVESDMGLNELIIQTRTLPLRSELIDSALVERLMNQYVIHTDMKYHLSPYTLTMVSQAFTSTRYFLPSVFENLCDQCIRQLDAFSIRQISQLIYCFTEMDYIPNNFSQLVEYIESRLLAKSKEDLGISVLMWLQLLKQLGVLQQFPEKALQNLFVLEGMEEIDAFIEGKN